MSLLSSRNSRDESTCRESQKPRVRPDGGRAVPSAGVLSCVQNQVFFGSGTGYPAVRSAVVANVRLTISESMHKFSEYSGTRRGLIDLLNFFRNNS